ncbi:serine/threonine-protein kinase [Streptomyces hoynatensis]|uniref:Serine/threonine protein kinase n=1 Tax=Streptomyces hoynatensis TaxID=1141874 RepID=A0A3A9YUD4_9ACTN|nr:serine/threonine-protein kinase [Streptomyces hoynatensis]RKN39550.1 serine/threonine protein kinase [Streptomyces hoynatensis]
MKPLGPTDPQRVGHYRLLGKLGAGGMGSVYLARSDRGRTVAVKLVQPELAAQPEFRRRFQHEVEAARRVGGDWTAPVLDADTEAATPWVATGYVAGPSLHEVVADTYGPLPERSLFLLANGLVKALRDIHAAGLVHRDLKPSNVMITIDGPRVIDFGIARALESEGPGLTRTGAAVGSPGFMSPEQCRGQTLTTASDIFCLGSVLTFAATGRTPFGDPHSAMTALMLRIVQGEHDLEGVPASVRPMIEACLNLDPAQRPTLEQLVQHTEIPDDGEPWLPGALVARLGRHAVELLDSEDPLQTATQFAAGPPPQGGPPATPPPSPPPPSGTGVNAMPTMASATPPPGYGTPPPGASYGYPQQAPPPGYPQPTPLPGQNPYGAGYPGGPAGPGGPQPPGGPKPGGRNNALLIGIAVGVVIVLAVVIAVVASGGGDDDPDPNPTATGENTEGPTGGPTDGGSSQEPGTGSVPDNMIGAWEGRLQGDDTAYFERIEIVAGEAGATVATQWTVGPTAMCVESSTLSSSDGTTVTLQGSGITSQTPSDAGCQPYGNQTLQLQGSTLHWEDDAGYSGDLTLSSMTDYDTYDESSGDDTYDGMPYSVFDQTFAGAGYTVAPEVRAPAGEMAFTLTQGNCTWTDAMISGGLQATSLVLGPGTVTAGSGCDPLPSFSVQVNVAEDGDASSLVFTPFGADSGGFTVNRE